MRLEGLWLTSKRNASGGDISARRLLAWGMSKNKVIDTLQAMCGSCVRAATPFRLRRTRVHRKEDRT